MVQSGQAAKYVKKKSAVQVNRAASARAKFEDDFKSGKLKVSKNEIASVGKLGAKVGAAVIAKFGKDVKVADAMKKSAEIKKRMDAVDASDKAAKLAAAKKVKDGLKSGALKMTGPGKKPVTPKPSVSKPKYDPASSAGFRPATPAKKAASKPNASKVAAQRVKDLKAEKYRASLSKEPKPLSKEPKLSNETKKLLEKFQRPLVEPPSTKTGLGGMIGEARPAAAGAKREFVRQAYKKRPIRTQKADLEVITQARIDKAVAAKKARAERIQSLRKPQKPAPAKDGQKLTQNNKRGRYDKEASEQDLEGSMDVQTVRGRKYPDGYQQRPSRDGATIESRTSQHPGSRGREIDKSSAKTPEEILQQQVDNAVNSKWTRENKYPAAEGTTRRVRLSSEARLAAVKRQVRAKRAAEVARKARVEAAKKKLSAKKRIAIKKDAKAVLESSKKRTVYLTPGSK